MDPTYFNPLVHEIKDKEKHREEVVLHIRLIFCGNAVKCQVMLDDIISGKIHHPELDDVEG